MNATPIPAATARHTGIADRRRVDRSLPLMISCAANERSEPSKPMARLSFGAAADAPQRRTGGRSRLWIYTRRLTGSLLVHELRAEQHPLGGGLLGQSAADVPVQNRRVAIVDTPVRGLGEKVDRIAFHLGRRHREGRIPRIGAGREEAGRR